MPKNWTATMTFTYVQSVRDECMPYVWIKSLSVAGKALGKLVNYIKGIKIT